MKEELKKQIAAEAAKIIFANEGNYASVNPDDNGALSVGKVQWHGNRALSLLKKIIQQTGQAAEAVLGKDLYREITTASDWGSRKATAAEKTKLSKILGSVQGKQAQDAQAEEDILSYVTHGVKIGIEDPQSLVYFADLENQGGAGASKRVGNDAAQRAGGAGKVTLAFIHTAALADRVMGKYSSRRNLVYKKAQELFKEAAGANKNQTGGKETMSIRIGHASISENGSVNGAKGDSTGKEVCVREWYAKPWDFVAIHPEAAVREKHAQAVEAACRNDNIGYGQGDRNTLNTLAKSVNYDLSKVGKCNCDCSSFSPLALLLLSLIFQTLCRKGKSDYVSFSAYTGLPSLYVSTFFACGWSFFSGSAARLSIPRISAVWFSVRISSYSTFAASSGFSSIKTAFPGFNSFISAVFEIFAPT